VVEFELESSLKGPRAAKIHVVSTAGH
jgi:cold shock CspA family protein